MFRYALVLIACLLAACAQAPASFDYDAAAPLAAARTYALLKPAAGAQYQSLDNNRIEAALRKALAARNLQEVAREQADVLVAYRVEQQRKLDDSGVSFGFGVGGFGVGSSNMGVGVSTGTSPKEVREGQLVVDVVDPQRQQVMWSARANHYLRESMQPDQRDELIGELVTFMFADFPPEAR